jgi:hypothetical protein
MSVVLDDILRVESLRFAALCRVRVTGVRAGSGLIIHGEKIPLAVLIGEGASVRAHRLDGSAMSEEEVEALCAGAWGRFRAARADGDLR